MFNTVMFNTGNQLIIQAIIYTENAHYVTFLQSSN